MDAVCAAAPLALANQLPLPRLYSALVWSSRKLRYIRNRPLLLHTVERVLKRCTVVYRVWLHADGRPTAAVGRLATVPSPLIANEFPERDSRLYTASQ